MVSQGSQSRTIRPPQDYAFLQYLLKQGFMQVQHAVEILEQLYGPGGPKKLSSLISKFNTSLREHNISIEKMKSLVRPFVNLVNAQI